jgi:hypothetical protein
VGPAAQTIVIAGWSRMLINAETWSPTSDRQLLAIQDWVQKWHYIVHSDQYLIIGMRQTGLGYILTRPRLTALYMEYYGTSQNYSFINGYISDTKNQAADILTNCLNLGCDHRKPTQCLLM